MNNNDHILKAAEINDVPGGGGGGSSSSGESSSESGGDTESIVVIDAKKFVSSLKKLKRKLRCTYVESERGGAKLFRYIDYRSLMIALSNSLVEVSIGDMGFSIEDVPASVELDPLFEVEPYEIDIEDDSIPDVHEE